MKMIKLLVLTNGKMVKLSEDASDGLVYDSKQEVIGKIYSVTPIVFKERHSLKEMLVDSIYASEFLKQRGK